MPLSSESVDFFVCITGLAFSFAGIAGAIELLKTVGNRDQENRYFVSVLLIATMIMVAALLPLALAEISGMMLISSYWLFGTATGIYCLLVYEIASGKVQMQNKQVSLVLFALTAAWIVGVVLNAHLYKSVVVYKVSLMWATFILGYRFYLFSRHIAQISASVKPE